MRAVVLAAGKGSRLRQITYAYQREQLGLAHAILQAEPHIDGDFRIMFATTSSVVASATSPIASRKIAPTPPSSS